MREKFTTNSTSFTDKHNDIMDELLYSYVEWSWNSREVDIDYDSLGNYYFPTTERGLEILEYLRDINLIEQIFDEEEV